jgi:DNA polymerase III delta subunit
MSDALAEGNLPGAHQHLQNMVRRGEAPLGVLALVQKSVEGALKSQSSSGLAGFALDKKPAYPLLQKKYQALSTHCSKENLLHAYRQCQRADFSLKSRHAHALLNLKETLPYTVGGGGGGGAHRMAGPR